MCNHWREAEKENGTTYEYCKGVGAMCRCGGALANCEYPDFFNIPKHRIPEARKRFFINRDVMKMEAWGRV